MRITKTFALVLALLTGMVPAAVPAGAAAFDGLYIDFEDGKLYGLETWGGNIKLAVTGEQAYSGKRSLLVSNPSGEWGMVQLRVDQFVEPDTIYDFSMWVRLKSVDSFKFEFFTVTGGSRWKWLGHQAVNKSDGWVYAEFRVIFTASEVKNGDIVFLVRAGEAIIDYYIDDFALVKSQANKNLDAAARLPSIKEIYKDYFDIGVAWQHYDELYLPFYQRHYSSVMYGVEFWRFIADDNSISFNLFDENLTFNLKISSQFHCHYLICPHENDWRTVGPDGALATRAEARANMEYYINEVVGYCAEHFDQPYGMNVINEAMIGIRDYDGDWRSALKSDGRNYTDYSYLYMAYENGADKSKGESGADFIYDAFVFTRLADPKAKLYFSDCFLAETPAKGAAIVGMMMELNGQWETDPRNTDPNRKLIEGIGDQSHLVIFDNPWIPKVTADDIERNIKLFADIGVDMVITELDVRVYSEPNIVRPFTPELEKEQADHYAMIFQTYRKYSDNISLVLLWITNDFGYNDFFTYDYPTLFNADMTPKLAYFAVADPEGYLEGNFDTEAKRQAWIQANSVAPALSTADDWAREHIQEAYAKGFLIPELQGDYKQDITRAEFIYLAMSWLRYHTKLTEDQLVAKYATAPDRTFVDVNNDPVLIAAGKLDITAGVNAAEKLFGPGEVFTRQQAAVMLTKVYNILGRNTANAPDAGFADIEKADDWARNSINFVGSNGVMGGDGVRFNPHETFSRQHSVTVFSNIDRRENIF